jgi:hypothetical protein
MFRNPLLQVHPDKKFVCKNLHGTPTECDSPGTLAINISLLRSEETQALAG